MAWISDSPENIIIDFQRFVCLFVWKVKILAAAGALDIITLEIRRDFQL